jgi:DNA-binding NtrC family response regulator
MKKEGKLLVVDDDKAILRSVEMLLENQFSGVRTISNPNLIHKNLKEFQPDIVLLDMNFTAGRSTGNEGIYWLKEIKKFTEDIVVILITAYGDIELAVKGMKEGAMDFVVKPWNNDKLISTLQAGYRYRTSQNKVKDLNRQKESLSAELNKSDFDLIGSSPEMQKVLEVVKKVAQTPANILITGENGTGKELIAKKIHNLSERSNAPLINVDLTTINPSLFESELFGHVQGAFTDAKTDKSGRFEMANGGTLFLDEIGNLSMEMQAKILTVLQKRELTPVGSVQPRPIDIRLICATNKNIAEEISKGLFREDLFYRINTIQLEIPPLRKRGKDIQFLADYYLDYYKSKYDKKEQFLTKNAKNKLMEYEWPGNVRELRHAIEKAVILNETGQIDENDFYFHSPLDNRREQEWPLKFEEIEKKAIIRALANNNGKLIDAATELGLTRQTLYNKLKKYNIDNS